MKLFKQFLIAFVTYHLAAAACAQQSMPMTEMSQTKSDGVRVATALVVAEIVAIDLETREVTLRDDQGEEVTILAEERVARLEEFAAGDMLIVEYLASIAGEIRAPTEEELKNPWLELSGEATSMDVSHPAVGSVRQFRSIATIKTLNREARTAIIEDARGRIHLITEVAPEKYDEVSVGDVGVVVFTEAVAVSVERQ